VFKFNAITIAVIASNSLINLIRLSLSILELNESTAFDEP